MISARLRASVETPVGTRPQGIASGGDHIEFETWPSTQASCHSAHDFQAKKVQNAALAKSASSMRTRLTRSGSASSMFAVCPSASR